MDTSLVETHVSVVFFLGDRAYKLKKPVRFDFVDLTGRAAREELCHREVELNRRLAPDVYEGVADIVGPDGEVCDHLVVMRRMPDDRRLSALVERGDPRADPAIADIAVMLARFHAGADRGPEIDRCATRDAVAELWHANFEQLAPFGDQALSRADLERAALLADAFLRGRSALFDRRIADGCVCDGHGDLLADDIYVLDDGPRILDCLEFDDRLRFGDVAADLAFLAMDLERLGAASLAGRLVAGYEAATTVTIPRPLLHHWIAYRAQVRMMVTCLRAAQDDSTDGGAGSERIGQAEVLLELCLRHLEAAEVRLVVVGGAPGTGKSTVAAGLGERLGASVIRSDVVRKELCGIEPERPAPAPLDAGIYSEAMTARTYAESLDRARRHLEVGDSVVLDASFGSAHQREAVRQLAHHAGARLVEVRCSVSAEVAERRAQTRRMRGGDPSDADAEVARRLAQRADPWPESVEVPTAGSVVGTIDHAVAVVQGSARVGGPEI